MIKRPKFLGSAVSLLLLFSVISYAQTFVQQQDSKAQQSSQSTPSNQNRTNIEASGASKPGAAADESTSLSMPEHISDRTVFSDETVAVAAQMYTATAYSLRGRTASGRPVSRGLIAADPAVLPLGTRVRLEAGSFSGEYIVADTGGAVRGRRIDIWTPSTREAMKFGRRLIKLTVLSFGAKRQKANSSRLTQDKTADPSPTK